MAPKTRKKEEKRERVVVFIDEANVFEDAKRTFRNADRPVTGRIKPWKYGLLLADRQPFGATLLRELVGVRVYAGTPSSSKEPAAYGAHRKQAAAWEKSGADVLARPLRYPQDWPKSRPEQKGVDVQIAIDIVVMAIRNEYDVAILASADTDLRPALEACDELDQCPTLEVAAWKGETGYANKLTLPGKHLWCHHLNLEDYNSVADRTSYSRPD
jgi:uncharacterized LabA/DUF88 family protein